MGMGINFTKNVHLHLLFDTCKVYGTQLGKLEGFTCFLEGEEEKGNRSPFSVPFFHEQRPFHPFPFQIPEKKTVGAVEVDEVKHFT